MKRLRAILFKEFRHIRRDPLSLGVLILVPALLLVLYGYALSFDVKHIPVAVFDRDRTPLSRALLDSVFQNAYFVRAATLNREAQIDRRLDRPFTRAVLTVPRGLTAAVLRGEPAVVQVLIDGADPTTASITAGYFQGLEARFTRLAQDFAGAPPAAAAGPRVVLQPRVWFNPDLLSVRFLVPGLIGMLLTLSIVIASSLSIVRERERETIDQIRVSPIRAWELIAGKTLPYLLIGVLTMALVLAIARGLFGVVMTGSWLWLGITTLLFLFAANGIGLFISASTANQFIAFQVALFIGLLPSVLLSGFIFRIASMPWAIQAVTYLVIPRYFVAALRAIVLRGAGAGTLWPDWLGMVVLGCAFNLLAAMRLRRALR